MQADARAGLDLPLRLLVWEDEQGMVFVSYHDPMQLQEIYRLEEQKEILQKMQGVLKKLSQKLSKSEE